MRDDNRVTDRVRLWLRGLWSGLGLGCVKVRCAVGLELM